MNYHYSAIELSKIFNGTLNNLSDDLTVHSISIDSRKISKGDLFIAITGDNTNGHLYIEKALSKGAICAVANKVFATSDELHSRLPLILVSDSNQSLLDLANDYRQKLQNGTVIGITGSNGKTSAKDIAAGMCRFINNETHATKGNLNNFIGVPLTILTASLKEKWWVVEMGTNHFGEIATLSKIVKPDLGLITNIGESHLEFLINTEGVAKEKSELFVGMKKNSIVVVPSTIKHKNILNDAATEYHIQLESYGFSQWNNSTATKFNAKLIEHSFGRRSVGQYSVSGTTFKFLNQEFRTTLVNPLLLESLLGIITLLHLNGISLKILSEATSALQVETKGRMEIIELEDYLLVDDTYNANPSSFEAVLKSINAMFPQGRVIVVAGCMAELGKNSKKSHIELGKKMKAFGVKSIFSYGNDDARFYQEGWKSNKEDNGPSRHTTEIDELIEIFNETVEQNDVVLVKGSRSAKMERFVSKLKENWDK